MRAKIQQSLRLGTRHLTIVVSILLGIFLVARSASADPLDERIRQLRSAEDFRVRVQAALNLGASGEKRAVIPLCQALADANRTVRLASATALSRLKLGGKGCLKRRLEKEQDPKVKAALGRALQRVSGASSGAEPMIGPKTKAYLAIDRLVGPSRFNNEFRNSMVKTALSDSRVAFARVRRRPW